MLPRLEVHARSHWSGAGVAFFHTPIRLNTLHLYPGIAGIQMDPTEIKDALMIDESKLQQQMLSRVAAHLGFDSAGRVIIRNPMDYRQRDLIALYLVGVKYAAAAGLRSSDAASLSELCEALGLQNSLVAARLSDLRAEGKVESPNRGESRVVAGRIPWTLNEIDEAMKKTIQ